jgi:ubiquinone/menaquinone biosynthesis C-methylase UbiE
MDNESSWIKWTPERYSRLSRHYDWFARVLFPVGELGRARVIAGLSSGAILDVACGTGTLLALARHQGLSCHGIDTSAGMLEQARAKVPEAEFKLASFYEIPYPDDTFDYVVETNAVSGVDIAAHKVISEMVRVCKPGGEVRIGDYGKAPDRVFWMGVMERLFIWCGDFPHDYKAIFTALGYESENELLGWRGMYQFIRVIKP